MKTKISKILGVAVTLAMLVSMMVVSAPVSAGTLSFSAESIPTTTAPVPVVNVVNNGLDINDVAANGDIVYVATNNATNAKALYKSTDGGATYKDLSTTTDFPAGVDIKKVAIAKDNPDVVAFISAANIVYYSTNGGSSWTALGTPSDTDPARTAAALNCIDIYAGTVTYIVVGGVAGGTAEMFTYKIAILESWQARYTNSSANDTHGMNGTQTDMKAVKFSPNFGTDKAILTVTTDAGNNAVFQVFRYEAGDTDWNGEIGYFNNAEWGTGMVLAPGVAVAGGVAAADIAVPSSYLASDDDERLVYIAIAGATSGGGPIRLVDTVQTKLTTWNSIQMGAVGSLAYNESGTLVAGSYGDNKVYQFLTPTATAPKATKINSLKQPGGTDKVNVVYTSSNVLAGTGGNEGAMSMSTDDGYSFNDVGLINTTIGAVNSFDINADGSIIYMTTLSGADASVWLKKGGVWKRIYSDKGTTANLMVRIAPENADAVYLAQLTTQEMWVSKDGGLASWKSVPIYALGAGDTILDFAVASADVVYAIDNDGVSKTENSGASWGAQVRPTAGMSPHNITVAPNGDVLVGGTDGFVSYSKDKGATFEQTKTFTGNNAFVTYDDGYATNNIIYVGIGTSVKRSKATTTDTPALRGSTTAGTGLSYPITGISQIGGVIYVLSSNGTDSQLMQSLKLETAADTAAPYTDADWSYTAKIANVYNTGANVLDVSKSGTSAKLWAINSKAPIGLHSFTDPISLAAPAITTPADKAVIPVNIKNGDAYDVTYTFKRYASTAITTAHIQIATDSSFLAIVHEDTTLAFTGDTLAAIIGPSGSPLGTVVNYMPGTTYYWRVRTTTPINSPWTATRSFTIDSLVEPFAPSGPAVGAVDVSTMPSFTWAPYPKAIKYVIEVSEFPDFKIIDWSANVDNTFYVAGADEEFKYSTTYYWRVKGVLSESPYTAGPWVTGVFTTMADPATIEDPGTGGTVVITTPGETKYEVIQVPVETAAPIPTYILWVIVGVGALLIIALIVLIVRTRRVA